MSVEPSPRINIQSANLPATADVSNHGTSGTGEVEVIPRRSRYLPWKVLLDYVLLLVLLIPVSATLLVFFVLVKLTSRGPAFYSQTRLGKNGKPFTLYKLRSMVNNAEALTGPVWAKSNDDRITPIGAFLRKSHVDEFPQLLNIFLGQMSLVGPRPERPEFAAKLEWELPNYSFCVYVKPGLTGLAQLRLPPDESVDSVRKKLLLDLSYVREVSLWLDVRLLFFTGVHMVGELGTWCWNLVRLPSYQEVEKRSEKEKPQQDDIPSEPIGISHEP